MAPFLLGLLWDTSTWLVGFLGDFVGDLGLAAPGPSRAGGYGRSLWAVEALRTEPMDAERGLVAALEVGDLLCEGE